MVIKDMFISVAPNSFNLCVCVCGWVCVHARACSLQVERAVRSPYASYIKILKISKGPFVTSSSERLFGSHEILDSVLNQKRIQLIIINLEFILWVLSFQGLEVIIFLSIRLSPFTQQLIWGLGTHAERI